VAGSAPADTLRAVSSTFDLSRPAVTPRFAAIKWATWILVALAAALLLATYARSITTGGVDYSAYFDAGNWVRQGHSIYGRSLLWRDVGYAPEYPMPKPDGMAFLYPPAFAVAIVPFTFLSIETGFAIWLGILFVALVAATYITLDTLFPSLSRNSLLTLTMVGSAAAAFFQPMRTILITGQVDVALILLMALALRAFLKHQDVRTAVLLAVAIAIKPTMGFLVLFLLWKRAYRAAIYCCAIAGVLLLVPFAVTGGVQGILEYIAVSSYVSGPGFDVSPINQSPWGLLLRFFTPNAYTVPFVVAPLLPTIGRIVIGLATLAGLAAIVSRSRTAPVIQQALEYSLVIIGLLVAGPLSEAGHYGYLLIAIAAIAAALLQTHVSPKLKYGLAATLVLLFGYLSLPSLTPIDCVFFEYWQAPVAGAKVLLTGMHVYGLLAMTALAMVTLWQTRRAHG
jgi:glycosyl transferase family 87